MKKTTVTFSYKEDETYILVRHVPAEVCTKCWERLYTPEVTDRLLQFAKQPVKSAKMIQVPVYDFTERAMGQDIMRESEQKM